jgi:hypothetical protein
MSERSIYDFWELSKPVLCNILLVASCVWWDTIWHSTSCQDGSDTRKESSLYVLSICNTNESKSLKQKFWEEKGRPMLTHMVSGKMLSGHFHFVGKKVHCMWSHAMPWVDCELGSNGAYCHHSLSLPWDSPSLRGKWPYKNVDESTWRLSFPFVPLTPFHQPYFYWILTSFAGCGNGALLWRGKWCTIYKCWLVDSKIYLRKCVRHTACFPFNLHWL